MQARENHEHSWLGLLHPQTTLLRKALLTSHTWRSGRRLSINVVFAPDGTQHFHSIHHCHLQICLEHNPQLFHSPVIMGFNLHAEGTTDLKEVRNWRIHLIAIIASMSAIASESGPYT